MNYASPIPTMRAMSTELIYNIVVVVLLLLS